MFSKNKLILFSLSVFLCTAIAAQPSSPITSDTLRISLDSAENMFLRNNYQLLAQRYNIDAARAQEIQAGLFPNPNVAVTTAVYNTATKNVFPFGNNGEITGQVNQLIYLAGKRNKQISIAKASTKLAEYQFYDLVRTLKYTLRTDFFNIYYLQLSAKLYSSEINSLQQVVNAFNEQQGKGYIAEKEVVRIKAQLYTLESEYNDILNQISDVQSELRLVLQMSKTYVMPQVDENAAGQQNPLDFTLESLVDSAYKARPDLMIARQNTEISKLNYNYQKALATPDITLSAGYDQQGSYIKNYNFIGASIDLPFFNRNQGNIKAAKVNIDINNALQKGTEATVEEQVYNGLQKAINNDKLYKQIDPAFEASFERLMHEVLVNYQKRNISLLDFLDFYDSYKQNMLQQNQIKYNRLSALEDINYYTGKTFYNK